jgi:hypothetical protein
MNIKNNFHRIKPSISFIAKKAFDITVAIYALAGLISTFVSFEGMFKDNYSFWHKLLLSIAILTVIWFFCALLVTCFVIFSRKRKVVEGYNGKAVFITYGDLFSPNVIKESHRFICFAVNRCFDTIVDEHLISSNTIHGIAFNNLYNSSLFTASSLNEKIQASISASAKYNFVSIIDKPSGNLKRYEVGTCADLEINDKLHYLLLGLSNFNKDLKAQTTRSDYVLAIQKMIEAIDTYSQGFPVLLPIIGSGRSRTDINEDDALRYMIEAFRINKVRINSDIYIVIKESARNRISIFDN